MQERKQKLLSRNLEFVFCLTISKSQGEARNLESGRPEPVFGICSTPKIRGEARNLESGRPEPVLGICSTPKTRDEARNLESGWSEPRSWKLVYSRIWAAPRPQLNGTVCPAPPGAFEPIPLHSFFFLRLVETRNLGKWKLRSLYR